MHTLVRTVTAALALAAVTACFALGAQTGDLTVGTWILNVAMSTYDPGRRSRRARTLGRHLMMLSGPPLQTDVRPLQPAHSSSAKRLIGRTGSPYSHVPMSRTRA